jgi:hypothetical protein
MYLSTDLGPGGQNPFLALVTPLLPGKSVLFGFPRHDQAMMNDFKDLMESGQFRPLIDRTTRWRRSSRRTGTSRPGRKSETS